MLLHIITIYLIVGETFVALMLCCNGKYCERVRLSSMGQAVLGSIVAIVEWPLVFFVRPPR